VTQIGPGEIQLTGTVGHGLGTKYLVDRAPTYDVDLVATNAVGTTRFPAAIGVTAIWASASRGNDVSGRGTHDAPFRTVTRALATTHTSSNDVVQLEPGTYRDGETWPIHVDGFTMQSDLPGANFIAPAGTPDGLVLGNTTVTNIAVSRFTNRCIFLAAPTATATIVGGGASSCRIGLLSVGTLYVRGATFTNNSEAGIESTAGDLLVYGCTLDYNSLYGVSFTGGSLNVSGTRITNSETCVSLNWSDGDAVNLSRADAPSAFDCTGHDIVDARPSNSSLIWAVDVVLSGTSLTAGSATGPIDKPPSYWITGNNVIAF
jgi:hypothetical protein